MKKILALVLAVAMCGVGCTDNWIKIAIADLPVLTQMALNIATLVTTLNGQSISAQDAQVVQNISAQASRDLSLLDTLYNQYKANPSAGTLAGIQNAITDLNASLPAILNAAHIANPTLSARIVAAVNLILTTVNSFAALLPSTGPKTAQAVTVKLPTPKDLKRAWNAQVYPQFK
jgi:hypothetical protein